MTSADADADAGVRLGGGDAYTEYGVLCDRRGQRLGITLLATGRSIEAVRARGAKVCSLAGAHEHLLVTRRVYATD